MNTRSKLLVFGIDVLILAELTLTMYLGHVKGGDFTVFFLKTFLPMAALTLFLGKWALKKIGRLKSPDNAGGLLYSLFF